MELRNFKYNRHGTIDCEIEHPQYGWIPFTASPDDVEPHGREIYAAIMASGQPIAPAPEPETPEVILDRERSFMVVSAFQARAALLAAGLLDAAEAAVAAAPRDVQLAWQHAREFRRNSPTILALAPALQITEAQLDDLFNSAAAIEA